MDASSSSITATQYISVYILQQSSSSSSEVANVIEDDGEGVLPPGWQMQVAPNGRKFFIDHRNPIYLCILQQSSSSSSEVANVIEDDGEGVLPPGWQMQVAPNGRKFFIDHRNPIYLCLLKYTEIYWVAVIDEELASIGCHLHLPPGREHTLPVVFDHIGYFTAR